MGSPPTLRPQVHIRPERLVECCRFVSCCSAAILNCSSCCSAAIRLSLSRCLVSCSLGLLLQNKLLEHHDLRPLPLQWWLHARRRLGQRWSGSGYMTLGLHRWRHPCSASCSRQQPWPQQPWPRRHTALRCSCWPCCCCAAGCASARDAVHVAAAADAAGAAAVAAAADAAVGAAAALPAAAAAAAAAIAGCACARDAHAHPWILHKPVCSPRRPLLQLLCLSLPQRTRPVLFAAARPSDFVALGMDYREHGGILCLSQNRYRRGGRG